VPGTVLVARNFAENRTDTMAAIMDLIFYSGRKTINV
jgi:hypothetical protein